jgi:hypothetical protein
MKSLRTDLLRVSTTIGLAAIALHAPCWTLARSAVDMADVTASFASNSSVASASATVFASVPAFAIPPALPPGGNYTPLGDAMRIQGQPISAWIFNAPGSLSDIASWLTKRQPALRDLWVMPGSVVLAGIADGMQWVARLSDAGDNRTRGTISVLAMSHGAKSAEGSDVRDGARDPGAVRGIARVAGQDRVTPDVAPGWRLNGGKLHFDLRSRDKDAVTIEQIWTHAAPPLRLSKKLRGDLVADGWHSVGMDAMGMGAMDMGATGTDATGTDATDAMDARHAIHYWSRGGTTLSLTIVPLDLGSGVTAILRIGI